VIDDDLLHQRQSEAGPAVLRREERVEDLAEVRRPDARSRIVNGDGDPARRPAHHDLEPAHGPARQRLARVANQVDQRLPQLRLVGGDVGQPGVDLDADLDARLRQLASRHLHDRRHDRAEALAFQLGTRQAREAQVRLGDLGQPVDLADDRRDQPPRLLAPLGDLVAQQLGVEPDRRERVAHFVGDVRRHAPDGGETLGPDQAVLALLDRVGHRVELAREIADLVVRFHAGALRIVAAAQPARVHPQDRQRPQRPQRQQRRRSRDRQTRQAQRQRRRQRRLLVVRQPLRDLSALTAQRAPHPVQAVRQRREVALELGPRLRVDGHGRRRELTRDRVQLAAQARDLPPPVLEIGPSRRLRLFFQVMVDDAQRIVDVLPPHAKRQRQVGVEARRRPAPQRRREVVQGLPGRVDRPLQLQIGLVGHHPLPGAVDRPDHERRVDGERHQEDTEGKQDLEAHYGPAPTLARRVTFLIFEHF